MPGAVPQDLNPATAYTNGTSDMFGIGSKFQAESAPGSQYQWQGPSNADLQKQQNFYANLQAPTLNTNPMAQQQAQQTQLANQLMQQANGQGTSAAQAQLQAGQQQNLANMLAAAHSATGPGASLAGYNAMQAGAQAGAQTNQQAAILRAQEQNQAQGQLANVLNQQQAANLEATKTQAQLQEQQLQSNQQTDLGYANAMINAGQGQSALQQAQAKDMMSAQQLNQDTSKTNASNSKDLIGGLISGGGSLLSSIGSIAFSDINAKSNIAPAGSPSNYQPLAAPTGPNGVPASMPAANVSHQMAVARPAIPQSPAASMMAPPVGVMSDEGAKNVDFHEHGTISDKYLDSLSRSASTYTYKDPGHEPTDRPHGGHYLGVMAQSLERSPTGDTLVEDTPHGKALNMGANLSAALAGLGRLHERLSALEHGYIGKAG